MRPTTIENRFLSLGVDPRGRLVSLSNKLTRTELVTHPDVAEAWRMVVPTGRHTVKFVLGSAQPRPKIALKRDGKRQSLTLVYGGAVRARFTFELDDDAQAIVARAEIDNRSRLPVDEVEFPVIGGLGGRTSDLVAGTDRGRFYGDVLNGGLPDTGRESHHFVREHETAMFESGDGWGGGRAWLDLFSPGEGLYAGYHVREGGDFALKLERFPKSVPNAPAHAYPKGTPKWLRVWGLHAPQIAPGKRWVSGDVVIAPHAGDWHAGADLYSVFRHERLELASPPGWMRDFTGWTEILGKTYLGEVFHDFDSCAREVLRDAKVTGTKLVFYYGHTAIGAEGADFDQSPAPDLGGERGFRRMLDRLHNAGVRVMLLDHLHRWVNRDVPEYRRLGLERFAVLDETGRPRAARWWKETFLSCRRLAGPTPEWVEMCPACDGWRRRYLAQMRRTIARGVDGLELDTFDASPCFSSKHGHPVGAEMVPWKFEFVRRARAEAKRLNPDFALFAECMSPEAREVMDGFYADRFPDENGRIWRYLFPEIRETAVLVGNYAYDAVNRALMLGLGVETEIWGLRRTTLAACPELARYIGRVNRFRRKHPDVMMRGTFRDTLGATVSDGALFGVLEGPGARALVVRNPHDRPVKVRVSLDGPRGQRAILWRASGGGERRTTLPVRLALGPWEVAVLLAGAETA